MRSVAAQIREQKERRPADYCQGSPDCLWRVVSRGKPTPCPRHPVAPVPATPESHEEART